VFYLPQAIAAWIAAIWVVDWRRIHELLIYGFFASLVCIVQDQLGLMHRLWQYRDTGPLDTHTEISILIGLSAAPLFGIYFAQGLRPGSRIPIGRIVGTTALAMVPETAGLFTGNITYGNWWSYGWSVVAHLLLWLGFYGLFRWRQT